MINPTARKEKLSGDAGRRVCGGAFEFARFRAIRAPNTCCSSPPRPQSGPCSTRRTGLRGRFHGAVVTGEQARARAYARRAVHRWPGGHRPTKTIIPQGAPPLPRGWKPRVLADTASSSGALTRLYLRSANDGGIISSAAWRDKAPKISATAPGDPGGALAGA